MLKVSRIRWIVFMVAMIALVLTSFFYSTHNAFATPPSDAHLLAIYIYGGDNKYGSPDNLTPRFRPMIEGIVTETKDRPNVTAIVLSDTDDGEGHQDNTHITVIENGIVTPIRGLPLTTTHTLSPTNFEYNIANGEQLGAFLKWTVDQYRTPDSKVVVSYVAHGFPIAPVADLSDIFTKLYDMTRMPFDVGANPGSPTDRFPRPALIITPHDLKVALKIATNNGAEPFDVLDLVHCFAASLEQFYEVATPPDADAPYVERIVGAANYAYYAPQMSGKMLDALDVTDDANNMAISIMTAYDGFLAAADRVGGPNVDHPRTLTVVDTAYLTPTKIAMDNLSTQLVGNVDPTTLNAIISNARAETPQYDTTYCQRDFALNTEDALVDSRVFMLRLDNGMESQAKAVADLIGDAVVAHTETSGNPWFQESEFWDFSYASISGLAMFGDFYRNGDRWIVGDFYRNGSSASESPYLFVQNAPETWADVVAAYWSVNPRPFQSRVCIPLFPAQRAIGEVSAEAIVVPHDSAQFLPPLRVGEPTPLGAEIRVEQTTTPLVVTFEVEDGSGGTLFEEVLSADYLITGTHFIQTTERWTPTIAGPVTVSVSVDSDNRLIETNELNNQAILTKTVIEQPPASLILTATLSSQWAATTTVPITLSVKDGEPLADLHIQLYTYDTTGMHITPTLLTTVQTAATVPNFDLQLPDSTPPGLVTAHIWGSKGNNLSPYPAILHFNYAPTNTTIDNESHVYRYFADVLETITVDFSAGTPNTTVAIWEPNHIRATPHPSSMTVFSDSRPGFYLLEVTSTESGGDTYTLDLTGSQGARQSNPVALKATSVMTSPFSVQLSRPSWIKLGPKLLETRLGDICGAKFEDRNGNSVRDVGEPGISGWPIYIKNASGLTIVYTDANGDYCASLPPDNYTVYEDPAGMVQTFPHTIDYDVTVTASQTITNIDFGNKPPCKNVQDDECTAGTHDQFTGPEPTYVNANDVIGGWHTRCTRGALSQFDVAAHDQCFVHSFDVANGDGCLNHDCIISATMTIRLQAGRSPLADNDSITFLEGGTSVWSSYIDQLPGGAGWGANQAGTFTFDLTNMPNGGANILAMAMDGDLTIRIQDDTGVDWIDLDIEYCDCVPPPEGMVAWWTLDETGGTRADDLINRNVGTHINNPIPVLGKVDGALSFDGIDDYVEVPHDPSLNFGTGDFSIDMWVKTSDDEGVDVLLDKRYEAFDSVRGYVMYLDNGYLEFQLADGSHTDFISGVYVADGDWHLLAVTVDRSGDITFYVDTIEVRTSAVGRSGNLDNTQPLRLGSRSSSLTGHINAIIDEVELFNRVLTRDEIRDIYNAGAAGKCKPEADLGDASDSTNHWSVGMSAYLGDPRGTAKFPTVYNLVTGTPPGPIHHAPTWGAWLGRFVSGEDEADINPHLDIDGLTNIDPENDRSDRDKFDDGVVLSSLQLPNCGQTDFDYTVSSSTTAPAGWYVNVWFDFNRDGDWEDIFECYDAATQSSHVVMEWAVQDQMITVPAMATAQLYTTPAFVGMASADPQWMRITLSEDANATITGQPYPADGRGPDSGWEFGETEDYLLGEPIEVCDLSIDKSHNPARFVYGNVGNYILNVVNVGNGVCHGPITITDQLPSGMTLRSWSSAGWSCSGSGTVTCSHAGPVPARNNLPPLTLTVNVPTIPNAGGHGWDGDAAINCVAVENPNDVNPQNNDDCDDVAVVSIPGTKWIEPSIAGEPAIPLGGAVIVLRRPDGTDLQTETDEQGHYAFAGLPDGIYQVSEGLRRGWMQTFPNDHHTVVIENGRTVCDEQADSCEFNFRNKRYWQEYCVTPRWVMADDSEIRVALYNDTGTIRTFDILEIVDAVGNQVSTHLPLSKRVYPNTYLLVRVPVELSAAATGTYRMKVQNEDGALLGCMGEIVRLLNDDIDLRGRDELLQVQANSPTTLSFPFRNDGDAPIAISYTIRAEVSDLDTDGRSAPAMVLLDGQAAVTGTVEAGAGETVDISADVSWSGSRLSADIIVEVDADGDNITDIAAATYIQGHAVPTNIQLHATEIDPQTGLPLVLFILMSMLSCVAIINRSRTR